MPIDIFGDRLSGSLFWYKDNSYVIHKRDIALVPGYGYWVFLTGFEEGENSLVIYGTKVPEEEKNIPIQNGWNLIGPFDVPEEERKVSNYPYISGHPIRWDPVHLLYESVDAGASLELGQGYWGYIIDSDEITDMSLDGDQPFILDFDKKTIRINLNSTDQGDFTHVKTPLLDVTDKISVLKPVVLEKKIDENGQCYVKTELDSLIIGHEYFIELAPIRNSVQGKILRTSFYACDDKNSGVGKEEVGEYQNAIIKKGTAEWHNSTCDINIPNCIGKFLEIKIDVLNENDKFENYDQYIEEITDETTSIDISSFSDSSVKRCIISVRFVESADPGAGAESGWKSFTGEWNSEDNTWESNNQ